LALAAIASVLFHVDSNTLQPERNGCRVIKP